MDVKKKKETFAMEPPHHPLNIQLQHGILFIK